MAKKQVPLMLEKEVIERVDKEAEKILGTRSQIIRIALMKYLENGNNNTKQN